MILLECKNHIYGVKRELVSPGMVVKVVQKNICKSGQEWEEAFQSKSK